MMFSLICKKTLDSWGLILVLNTEPIDNSVQVHQSKFRQYNVSSSVHNQNVQTQDLKSQMDAGLISIYHLQRYVKVYKIRS